MLVYTEIQNFPQYILLIFKIRSIDLSRSDASQTGQIYVTSHPRVEVQNKTKYYFVCWPTVQSMYLQSYEVEYLPARVCSDQLHIEDLLASNNHTSWHV